MDSLDWRLFDIHYANNQSISKAQRLYLTALLAYLCLVWGWHIVASGEALTIQILGIALQVSSVWKMTPFAVTLFSLALIGSINAAGPAKEKLDTALKRLDLEPGVGREFVPYDLDTHKNIFDYFTFLRLHPEKKHFEGRVGRFEVRHFFYPGLLLWGIFTTYYAMKQVLAFEEAAQLVAFHLFGSVCLGLQIAFSIRPLWKATCRFLGMRKQATKR